MYLRQSGNRRTFLKLAGFGVIGTTILVACGQAAPTSPTAAPAAPSTASTSAGAATVAPTAPAAGPAPTPTLAPAAAAAQPSGQKIKLSISHIGGGSQDGSEKSYRMRQLRKAFPNVEIENRWMSYAAYVDKISLMTSTGDLADLQFANAFNDVPLMMDNNLLTEMDPILKANGQHILAATPKDAWDSTLYQGKQYAVAHNIYDLNVWGTYYRKDWLDKLGLAVPENLDAYAEVLKAFTTKDPTGTGQQTFGRAYFTSIKFDDDLFHAFGVGVGHHANGFWSDRKGKLELDWVQSGMRDAWTWLKSQWGAKVIDPDSITSQISYFTQPWTANKVGTQYMSWSGIDGQQLEMRKTAPKAEIIAGPALKGPGGQGFTGEGFPWVYVTPKKSQHPDLAVQVVDWFFTPQNAAQFICDGEDGYTLKGFNDKGWCQEYTLDERKAMAAQWTDKQNAAKDINVFDGVWMPISSGAVRPWLLDTMPAEMKTYFDGVLKARYSPAALKGMEYAQKYVLTTKKKRPTKSEQQFWPRLQSRFLELMTQAVAGTVDMDQGWKDWLSFFKDNGGPTLTDEVNALT